MIAIDFSMNSAGIIIGNDSNQENLKMLFFRQRKSDKSLVDNIYITDYPKDYSCNEERYYHIALKIFNFIEEHTTSKIVYIEDYSFSSNGKVFNIAEATGTLKQLLWINGYELTKVSPKSIKKFATGSGNASKTDMYDKFVDNTNYNFNKTISGPQKEIKKGAKNIPAPVTDLIDAYFLLQYALIKHT